MSSSRQQAARSYALVLSLVLSLVIGVVPYGPLSQLQSAYAQIPGFTTIQPVGIGTDLTASADTGDVDGDGDLDLVLGRENSSFGTPQLGGIYFNNGASGFSPVPDRTFGTPQDVTRAVALGDLDGDGDLDLVTGNDNQPNVVYRNDGSGNFTVASRLGSSGKRTFSLDLGDIDSDGDLDIVSGNVFQPNVIYINTGNGTFLTETSYGVGGDLTYAVRLGDIDGDGFLDIVNGNLSQWNVIYFNQATAVGTAVFHFGPINCSVPIGFWCFGTGSDLTTALALGDLNGDNRLDIAVGNNGANSIFLGTGFRAVVYGGDVGLSAETTFAVAIGDLDNDGDNDILSGNINENSIIYFNDGDGGFPRVSSLDANSDGAFTKATLIADFNADGRLDIFLGNSQQQSVVYLSDRGGDTVTREEVGRGGGLSKQLINGDFNGDGHADLVELNNGQANRVYLSNGTGGFDPGTLFGTGHDHSQDAAIADMDGDGDNDIVVANIGQSRVYLNNGAGVFYYGQSLCGVNPSVRCFGSPSGSTLSVAVGDLNNDGRQDIVVGQLGQGFIVLNNGSGNFFVSRSFGTPTSSPGSVALADMDQDNDLDIVAGQVGQSFVYSNDGAGNFPANSLWPFGFASDEVPTIDVADINSDGKSDVIYASKGQVIAYINGFNSFVNTVSVAALSNGVLGVASGDIDGDSDPDVAIAIDGLPITVFLNTGNGGFTLGTVIPVDATFPRSLSIADVSGDGAADLLVGNYGQQNRVYLGNGVGGFTDALLLGPDADQIFAVTMGDMNNDGLLDLVTGQVARPGTIFLNDGNGQFFDRGRVPFGSSSGQASAIAVGDLDGDGDLDIVTTYSNQTSTVTFNQNGDYSLSLPLGASPLPAFGVALADFNLDGSLDIITVNREQPALISLNNGSGLFPIHRSVGSHDDLANGVAVGDLNGDNAPDIVIANSAGQPNRLYLNDGTGGFPVSLPFSNSAESTSRVALGDMDGDGDLDIVAGNIGTASAVYVNDGTGHVTGTRLLVARTILATPIGLVLADFNHDRALDIMIAKYGQPSEVYLNNGDGAFPISWTFGPGGTTTGATGGDIDRDGDVDLVLAGFIQPTAIYRNGVNSGARLPNNLPAVYVRYPGLESEAVSFAGVSRRESLTIPIAYRLADPEGDPVRRIRASYSLDGGGTWRPAVATAGTPLTDLAAPAMGAEYTFVWDIFASGFFGQSDNVVFRIEAEPDVRPTRAGVAGPRQRPFVASSTQPFRVRGTQVRVVDEAGQPVAGALVYRLRAGQSRGGAPLSDSAAQPFRTDAQGFLAGRSALAVGQAGDQLVALRPVVVTDTYTLYHTSAPVSERGLSLAPLETPGVQTLTVSAERPLLLFNLDVALEWDARGDAEFMARLHEDLRRTSEILYDWTNGQVALGQVNVFHDARRLRYEGGWELWAFANVRVYASNRIRPNANKGGIVSEPTADPTVAGVEYEPGQIRIGAVWNRYGEAAGTLGEDWPRTLAHELGHYLFALDENYLGLNAEGVLAPVDGCRGGMSDPYRDDYSELHPRDGEWESRCAGTLSQQVNGRSDWESIRAFYPQAGLRAPQSFDENRGPALLPLAATTITDAPVITPSQTLDVPLFNLEASGERVQPSSGARAFLFRDDLVLDLGRPVLDRVEARGAVAGDRLCVFEPSAARLGCETVTVGDQTVALATYQDWRPEIVLTPVTSRTLTVEVTNLPGGLPLTARLYPADYPASQVVSLSYTDSVYRATFGPELITEPVFEGLVHLKVDDGSGREAVVDFALGGNPGKRWARTAPRGSPGKRWARTAPRGNPGKRWARTAPVISSDGQVILFTDQDFNEGEFYSFQTVNILPDAPTWVTTVGQAYRLTATANAPALADASISFSYLQREVPPGQERWLNIYHYNGVTWEKLPRSLSAETNTVSAPLRGPGVYALMASVELELRNSGWNYVRYPVAESRPAGDALAGLASQLKPNEQLLVYADAGPGAAQRWRIYATGVPDYVNSLAQLEFDQDYYIWVPRAMTLPIRGAALASIVAQPPATFYGVIGGMENLSPASGPVTARIGTTICGHGTIQLVGAQYVYVVSVEAESTQPGCGAPGRQVSFQVGAQMLAGVGFWDDSRVQALHLEAGSTGKNQRQYLPMVYRR